MLFAREWRKRHSFELIDLLVDRAEPALLPKNIAEIGSSPREARAGGTRAFAHLGEVKMATGTVKWFNATKGFGFIQP
ncbi:MAG: cold-shock protein, partial [Xanthobacteraceae bacterium]